MLSRLQLELYTKQVEQAGTLTAVLHTWLCCLTGADKIVAVGPASDFSCSGNTGRGRQATLEDHRCKGLHTAHADTAGDRTDSLLIEPESPQQSTSTATSASHSSNNCQVLEGIVILLNHVTG